MSDNTNSNLTFSVPKLKGAAGNDNDKKSKSKLGRKPGGHNKK